MDKWGFFVLDKSVLEFIESDQTSWETDVLPIPSKRGDLNAYTHKGFWGSYGHSKR